MANMLETPADFPGMEDVKEGDTKKFLVEAECMGKEDDGSHKWKAVSIDGVKLPEEDKEEMAEGDEEMEGYDTSMDEPEGPMDSKGVASLIMAGKPE